MKIKDILLTTSNTYAFLPIRLAPAGDDGIIAV